MIRPGAIVRERCRGTVLAALGLLAVLLAACATGPAGQAAPTTSDTGHSAHTVSGGVTTTTAASAVHPAKCQSKWVSSGSAPDPHPRSGSSTEIVPPTPGVMTVCRYAGFNQKVKFGTLEASRVVRGAALSAFVAYVDETNWQTVKPGVAINCPMSQGSQDLLEFEYPSGPSLIVSVAIGGCPLVSNGLRTVWGGAIGARIAAWVGSDALPQA